MELVVVDAAGVDVEAGLEEAAAAAGADPGDVVVAVADAGGEVVAPNGDGVVEDGADIGGVHREALQQVGEHLAVLAVDAVVLAEGVGDRVALGAVAVDPVGDLVVARELDAVDQVLGAVVAVADLEGRGAGVVAGEGERDQVHLHLDDDLHAVVLAAVVHLRGHLVELGLRRELAGELDLDVADRVEVQLQAILIVGAQLGRGHQRHHLLADEVVDAGPAGLDLLDDLLGELGDAHHLGVDAPRVAVGRAQVLRAAVRQHLVDVAAHRPGVERQRLGLGRAVELARDAVVDRLAHRQRLVAHRVVGDLVGGQHLVAAAGVAAAVAREGEAGAADEQQLVGELGELADGPVGVGGGERGLGDGAELVRPEPLGLVTLGLAAAVGLADEDGEAGPVGVGGAGLARSQALEEGQCEGGAAEAVEEAAAGDAGLAVRGAGRRHGATGAL